MYATGGPTTSVQDLLDEVLNTHAVAAGWTVDNWDTGNKKASIHKGTCYVHFQWAESNGGNIAIYQSLGFTAAGTNVWEHPDDSGTGYAGTTASELATGRCVNNIETAHDSYHCFNDDTDYFHVALEISSDRYRHFGWGTIDKVGDWTGGEYAYGHYWNPSDLDDPLGRGAGGGSIHHAFMLDGVPSLEDVYQATMHLEDFVDEPNASTKWALFTTSLSVPADRATIGRHALIGGTRCGPMARNFARFPISQLQAYKPLIPIPIYQRYTTAAPDSYRLLGYQKDTCLVNIGNLDPKEEFTVGADVWKVFPWVRKRFLNDGNEESWNAGIAYKKVT